MYMDASTYLTVSVCIFQFCFNFRFSLTMHDGMIRVTDSNCVGGPHTGGVPAALRVLLNQKPLQSKAVTKAHSEANIKTKSLKECFHY